MTNPMTTLGDIIYENASLVPTRLPGNITAQRLYAAQRGTGAVSAVPGWVPGPWFNVRDYGAVGDGVNPDDAAIIATFAAALAASRHGTVYFPAGLYLVTQGFTITVNGNLSVIGAGRLTAIIYQSSNTATPTFNFDLSTGIPKRNRVLVSEIGFKTTEHVNASTAIQINSGNTAIPSSENIGGSYIKGVSIDNYAEADTTGGWTNGIILRNMWHCHLDDIYGYGSSTSWTAAGASPGAGGAGPGSGVLLKLLSCCNSSFHLISGNFWSQGIRIDGAGNVGEIAAQGLFFNTVNLVQVVEAIHWYEVNSTGIEALNVVNFQFDNGNISVGAYGTAIYGEHGSDVNFVGGWVAQQDGIDVVKIVSMAAFNLDTVTFHISGTQSHGGLYLAGANANMFNACFYNGMPIQFDSLSAYNQLNNYDTSVVTDAGLSNRKLATLF